MLEHSKTCGRCLSVRWQTLGANGSALPFRPLGFMPVRLAWDEVLQLRMGARIDLARCEATGGIAACVCWNTDLFASKDQAAVAKYNGEAVS